MVKQNKTKTNQPTRILTLEKKEGRDFLLGNLHELVFLETSFIHYHKHVSGSLTLEFTVRSLRSRMTKDLPNFMCPQGGLGCSARTSSLDSHVSYSLCSEMTEELTGEHGDN